MQLGIYSIYGQLNEARLFNGFLPVLIGLYLCYIRERFLAQDSMITGEQARVILAAAMSRRG